MKTTVTTWGNSLGVRIPKSYAGDLGIENGSAIELVRTGNTIVIKPKKKNRREKFKIEELTKSMNTKNSHSLIEWGEPAGNEVW